MSSPSGFLSFISSATTCKDPLGTQRLRWWFPAWSHHEFHAGVVLCGWCLVLWGASSCLMKKLHSWSLAWKTNGNLYTGLAHSRMLVCVLGLPVERLRSSCLLPSQVLKSNCEAWLSLKATEYHRGETTCPFLYGYPSLCLYELSIYWCPAGCTMKPWIVSPVQQGSPCWILHLYWSPWGLKALHECAHLREIFEMFPRQRSGRESGAWVQPNPEDLVGSFKLAAIVT